MPEGANLCPEAAPNERAVQIEHGLPLHECLSSDVVVPNGQTLDDNGTSKFL